MRKFILSALALALTACAGTPAPPADTTVCRVADLPHSTVTIYQHHAESKVKAGAGWVLLRWTFVQDGTLFHGADNVYPNGSALPDDIIAVGCAEGLQVTEADHTAVY